MVDPQAFARARSRYAVSLRDCSFGPAAPSGGAPRAGGAQPTAVIRIEDARPLVQPESAPGCQAADSRGGSSAPSGCPGADPQVRSAGRGAPPPVAPGRPAGTDRNAEATSAVTPVALLSAPMRRLADRIDEVARRNEIDPLLLHAVVHVESRHRSDAVSPAGARGAMQLMPATAERFGVQHVRHLHDDATNLAAGAALLKSLQATFGGDLDLALAAYNAGEGAVLRHGGRVPPYAETQAYVRDVRAKYRELRARRAALEDGADTLAGGAR